MGMMIKGSADADAVFLPEWFTPSDRDVVCGWARQNHRHAGNQRFRKIVDQSAPLYVAAKSKLEKTQVIAAVVERVRRESPGGGFVKKDFQTGLWYEIGDDKARDKVGHAIRRSIEENKKRKTKVKAALGKALEDEKDISDSSVESSKLPLETFGDSNKLRDAKLSQKGPVGLSMGDSANFLPNVSQLAANKQQQQQQMSELEMLRNNQASLPLSLRADPSGMDSMLLSRAMEQSLGRSPNPGSRATHQGNFSLLPDCLPGPGDSRLRSVFPGSSALANQASQLSSFDSASLMSPLENLRSLQQMYGLPLGMGNAPSGAGGGSLLGGGAGGPLPASLQAFGGAAGAEHHSQNWNAAAMAAAGGAPGGGVFPDPLLSEAAFLSSRGVGNLELARLFASSSGGGGGGVKLNEDGSQSNPMNHTNNNNSNNNFFG
eukprot:Nitzschia sp. Nitz4//scaffold14_size191712//91472//92862//NITZ4_001721-RA/size191712-snap-gene-0.136-mRNA-1//1//CDS//3329536921//853//frame0